MAERVQGAADDGNAAEPIALLGQQNRSGDDQRAHHDSAERATSETIGRRFQLLRDDAQPFECHIKMMTRSGIWNVENLDLSQLVADRAYEFLFAWSPLKIKGATGSPGNPVAIY